jgi:hypothetical protein
MPSDLPSGLLRYKTFLLPEGSRIPPAYTILLIYRSGLQYYSRLQ